MRRADAARAEVSSLNDKKEVLAANLNKLAKESKKLQSQLDRYEKRRRQLLSEKPAGKQLPPRRPPKVDKTKTHPQDPQPRASPQRKQQSRLGGFRFPDSMSVSDLSSEESVRQAASGNSDGDHSLPLPPHSRVRADSTSSSASSGVAARHEPFVSQSQPRTRQAATDLRASDLSSRPAATRSPSRYEDLIEQLKENSRLFASTSSLP